LQHFLLFFLEELLFSWKNYYFPVVVVVVVEFVEAVPGQLVSPSFVPYASS